MRLITPHKKERPQTNGDAIVSLVKPHVNQHAIAHSDPHDNGRDQKVVHSNRPQFHKKIKVKGPEAKTEAKSFRAKAYKHAANFLVSRFPASSDFPPMMRIPMGVFYILCTLGIFVAFFVTGYKSGSNSKYLSPLENSEGICQTIPIHNTGNYLATSSGRWEGHLNFSYSEAAYVFSMTDYVVDEEYYKVVIQSVNSQVKAIGEIAKANDLAFSALFWMTFSLYDRSSSAAQRVYMTGTPLVVFNRDYIEASISSGDQDCAVESDSSFDTSNGHLSTTYSIDSFASNASGCSRVLNETLFGYNYLTTPSRFSLAYDTRSLLIATSVNAGILDIGVLTKIASLRKIFQFGVSSSFIVDYYVDPRYPGMDPITCTEVAGKQFCIVLMGGVISVPFFYHLGQSATEMKPCVCSALTPAELEIVEHPCHGFNFMIGILFWNSLDPSPVFEVGARHNFRLPADKVQTAAWYSSLLGQAALNRTDDALRRQTFDFCKSETAGYCSMLVYTLYDLAPRDWTMSANYFQLVRGACRDSISLDAESEARLMEQPYAQLVQDYKTCKDTKYKTLYNQAGIAIGTMQLLLPIVVVLIAIIVFVVKKQLGVVNHEHYTKTDKADALDTLSVAMLATRDELVISGGTAVGADVEQGGGELGTEHSQASKVVEGIVRDLRLHAHAHPTAVHPPVVSSSLSTAPEHSKSSKVAPA